MLAVPVLIVLVVVFLILIILVLFILVFIIFVLLMLSILSLLYLKGCDLRPVPSDKRIESVVPSSSLAALSKQCP